MQYWDSKGRLHDTEATNKVNFFQNLANQAQAGLDNLGSWINNTNPNSEAYRQKADVLASLITLPIGGGVSTWGTKAIANGLKPYIGRKIAQATTEGLTGGTAAGLVAGALDSGLKNENPLTGALKGGVVGGLSGLAGGYGLSKIGQQFAKKGVAKSTQQANQYFNDYIDGLTNKTKPMAEYRGLKQGINKGTMQDLLDQIAWHGSPYDFDKFSNDFIGKGEGGQVHGMGHYVALDKDIANNRYKNRLAKPEIKYNNEKIPFIEDLQNDKLVEAIINTDKQHVLDTLKKYKITSSNPTYIDKQIKYVEGIDENLLKKVDNSTLYKTSIPDDDVFLREDLPFSQQPQKVQDAIREIAEKSNMPIKDTITMDFKGEDTYGDIVNVLGNRGNKNPQQLASQLLNDYGIKGISYNGGIDGEARVIFNPDDIKILEKNGVPVEQLVDNRKAQLDLINKYNPAPDEYHTWVRNIDDIKSFEDTIKDINEATFTPDFSQLDAQNAIKNGKIKVYSSYPIDNGVFVTPSQLEAQSYAGNNKLYSQEIPINDIAWLDNLQGQYAPIQ